MTVRSHLLRKLALTILAAGSARLAGAVPFPCEVSTPPGTMTVRIRARVRFDPRWGGYAHCGDYFTLTARSPDGSYLFGTDWGLSCGGGYTSQDFVTDGAVSLDWHSGNGLCESPSQSTSLAFTPDTVVVVSFCQTDDYDGYCNLHGTHGTMTRYAVEGTETIRCAGGCDACAAGQTDQSCAFAATRAGLHSVDYQLRLGKDSFGESAGRLCLWASTASTVLAKPAGLYYFVSSQVDLIVSDGGPRQVKAAEGLLDVVPVTEFKYEIRAYDPTKVGAKTGDLYPVAGEPFKIVTVENPDASTNTFNRLRITETAQGVATVSLYVYNDETRLWTLTTGGGSRIESHRIGLDDQDPNPVDTIILQNGAGAVLAKHVDHWQQFAWGSNVVAHVTDPDGAALTDRLTYYDDVPTNDCNYSRLKCQIDHHGPWERYEYDRRGRVSKIVSAFGDAPPTAAENASRVLTITYTNVANQFITSTVTSLLGQEIARHYQIQTTATNQDIQCQTPGAALDAADNLVTTTTRDTTGPFAGQTRCARAVDGTLTLSGYELAPDGATRTTTNCTGAANADATAVIDGTRTITVQDRAGHTLAEQVDDIASGLLIARSVAVQTDEFGRATMVVSLGGTNETSYGCCGVNYTVDADGITTSYTHDEFQRVVTATRAAVTTSNGYDVAGQLLTTSRNGLLISSNAYDVASRLVATADGNTNLSHYAEGVDAQAHRSTTTTYPDGTTRCETYYRDGQLLSVTGTAVHGLRYEYGVETPAGETFARAYTKEIKLDANGAATPEWTKTYFDMLGRPYQTVQADGATAQSFYNNRGQLVKEVDPDGVTTLYAYGARGELETSAIDINRNGQIDYAGTDRITRLQKTIVNDHGTIVQRTTTTAWTTDNADVAATVAISDLSTDGLSAWQINNGLTNQVRTAGDRPNAQRTVTTTAPDGTQTINVYQDGRLQSARTVNPELGTLHSVSYSYDAHGRLATATDARTGATTFRYDNNDQLLSTATGDQTTAYQYDRLNRPTQLTLPDGGLVHYEYHPTGELQRTYGARSYPVAYTYDYAGRTQTMKTWQNFANDAGTALTTWNYDPHTGLLSAKFHNDGHGPAYTYTPAGRLRTRVWARNITTTYAYNNAGDLAAISHSDGTPGVTFAYDRRGRRIAAISAIDSSAYAYNDADQLLTESHATGPLANVNVMSGYDNLLRRSSLQVSGSSFILPPSSFSYDAASRLATVADAAGHSATYARLPNSSLLTNIVFATNGRTRMTTTKSFDNFNRLLAIQSVPSVESGESAESVDAHSYSYNTANQRTRAVAADGSTWDYQYDSLGQLTNAVRTWADASPVPGQHFAYTFDDIGNRELGTVNGQTAVYTANALNQYTERTVPGVVNLFGDASLGATITINNEPVSRPPDSEYWFKELVVPNTTSAVYTQLTTVGVLPGATTNGAELVKTSTGHAFIPRSPEQFTYDLDGNLTSDGRWTYTWDAENRLLSMESTTGILPVQVPRQKLEFTYDTQSRRIEKKVSTWQSDRWSLTSDLLFVYDDWNLIAILDPQSSILESFLWGLDLSGTEQGAGGVGGLLAITDHRAPVTTHFVSNDGAGNVTALHDALTTTATARYEYGPFGEPLRATGPAAPLNPFKFSTKYSDPETGFEYYGHRYYSHSLGKWLTRDPVGDIAGPGPYTFAANSPTKWVDPIGLMLAAVDGTGSRNWLARRPGAQRWNSHTRNFFTDYAGPGAKRYWHGPDNATTGSDARKIHDDVMAWICAQLANNRNEPINLVGHSRGGYIVMEVARELKDKGCPCKNGRKAIPGPIQVNFLGMYDAVDMVAGYGEDETVPSNVDYAAHAMGDPSVGSRRYFNTADHGAEDTSNMRAYNEKLFDATHGGIGGDPWGGDHPRGMTEERDRAGSAAADSWMRSRAHVAGVSLNF